MRVNDFLWLAVTDDALELPIYIEESAAKLAKKCGVPTQKVIKHANNKTKSQDGITYRKVSRYEPLFED